MRKLLWNSLGQVCGDAMKIATWNVERLGTPKKLSSIVDCCHCVDADIFVLTETDERICLGYPHCHSTKPLHNPMYRPTERRVSISSRYPIACEHPTYDSNTAICVEVITPHGHLLVYGTIMGIYGNRHSSFQEDVARQLKDLERLSRLGIPLCICGDFNCSFSDNYYFTKWGRTAMTQSLAQYDLALLTGDRPQCIDHIAVSQDFLGDADCVVQEWNCDKNLSDHKGISVTLLSK